LGDGCKIGAGSIVLRPVPTGATAVGVPAKIVGWSKEKRPASTVDMQLLGVIQAGTEALHSQNSSMTDDTSLMDSSSGVTSSEAGLNILNMTESPSKTDMNETKEYRLTTNDLKPRDLTNESLVKNGLPKNERCTQELRQSFSKVCFSSIPEELKHDTDICSPFGHFLSCEKLPQGCINYPELRCLLLQYTNATNCQVGEIFFTLLKESNRPELGYIHPPDILKTKFLDIACDKAGLDRQTCQMILDTFNQSNEKSLTKSY